jgi:hypothetical protein
MLKRADAPTASAATPARPRSACLRGLPGGEHRRDVVAQQRDAGAVDVERSRRLLWVISATSTARLSLPVFPMNRKFVGRADWSVLCQKRPLGAGVNGEPSKAMKSVPEEEFVVSIHWHFMQPAIGRDFVIRHRMDLSICNGAGPLYRRQVSTITETPRESTSPAHVGFR